MGITARADWRGPNVLKGRSVGHRRVERQRVRLAILSAAIFVAEYGDWPFSGCDSVIGTVSGVP